MLKYLMKMHKILFFEDSLVIRYANVVANAMLLLFYKYLNA